MKIKVISVLLLAVIALTLSGCLSGSCYSEEEHIEFMSESMREKLLKKDVTDFDAYPLYNENDEFEYCLFECEPSGFAFSCVRNMPFDYYYADRYVSFSDWQRMIVRDTDAETVTYNGVVWAKDEKSSFPDAFYECDEEGDFVYYSESPFKLAGVLDQRMYFLEVYHGYIPAVKAENGKYINLISFEEFEYGSEYQEIEYEYAFPKLKFGFFVKNKLKTPNIFGVL